jgi:SAM-dependent methyltransferase
MPLSFRPARRRGVEILDDPAVPDAVRLPAMADVARANRLFGGTRALIAALRDVAPALPRHATLLDIGAGTADITVQAQRELARRGVSVDAFGVDISEPLVRNTRPFLAGAIVADGAHLPLADDVADVVMCSQVLHHFAEAEARHLIAELHRVSRGWVVIADLRRSWLAAGGFHVASRVLGFHPVTRADGMTSVFRGFLPAELSAMIQSVTGRAPRLRSGAFWRVTAAWRKRAPTTNDR